ncbi:MAG: exosortase/archaeosortase family protein [Bacteroidota bacterium]
MSRQQTKNVKDLSLFLLQLLAIWLSWKGIVYITGEERIPLEERLFPRLSEQWEALNNAMRWVVLNGSEKVLNIGGYATENTGYVLRIKDRHGVGLGNYCLGFQLIYYFSMLIFISDLSNTRKLFAIVTGIPIVVCLNICRFAALCYITVYHHHLMKFSHEYFFSAIVLGVLMLYYLFLIRKT